MHDAVRQQAVREHKNWKMPFELIPGFLSSAYGLTEVRPVRQDLYGDYCYFTAKDGETRLFIKWGGGRDDCAHEYKYNSRLHALNPENFNGPKFCRYDDEVKCLWMEYLESENLENLLRGDRLSGRRKASIIRQLIKIHESLVAANCVHRDIKLKNFLYTADGRLVLVDFQYAVDFKGYAERSEILREPGTVRFQVYGPGKLLWDDAYSMLRVVEVIGRDEETASVYDAAVRYFKKHLGKRVLQFPGRKRRLIKRKIFKIVAGFLPVKTWRVTVQHLWLK